jgi:MoxR-like ATPase
MFVIQRILERDGKFTLLDQNRVIEPHPDFRLFATANTVGLGNLTGMYHGTQVLNHAQIDRWNIVATLNYLPREEEVAIVLARVPSMNHEAGRKLVTAMVAMAELTRKGHAAGDLSTLMSPRTVITWAENLRDLRRPGAGLPPVLPQQVRRGRARAGGRVLPALLRCRAGGVGDARRGRDAARLMPGPRSAARAGSSGNSAPRNSAPPRCAP